MTPRFRAIDLSGPNPAAKFGLRAPLAINDAGVVSGVCEDRAAVWEKGKIHFIGGPNTYAWGINRKGEVAIEDGKTGLLWRKGELSPLPIQPQPGEHVVPRRVADGRLVMGTTQSKHFAIGQAWVLKGEQLRWLADGAEALGASPDGPIVGYTKGESGPIPVLWEGSKLVWLPLPTRCKTGRAVAVNRQGVIVGAAKLSDFEPEDHLELRAVRWRPGQAPELLFPGVASAINDWGWVVGHLSEKFEGSGAGAVLWLDGKKHLVDELVADRGPWHITELHDLNNKGQLVGLGTYRDELRACLLSPV